MSFFLRPIVDENNEPPRPSAPPSDPKRDQISVENKRTNSGTAKDEIVTDATEERTFISKEELIKDLNEMLKMKFNQKTKEKLDFETLKKVSKGKLAELLEEAHSDILSDKKVSNSKNFDKLYENLKNVRFEHKEEDDDNNDRLEVDPFDKFDDSEEYDELEDLNDEL